MSLEKLKLLCSISNEMRRKAGVVIALPLLAFLSLQGGASLAYYQVLVCGLISHRKRSDLLMELSQVSQVLDLPSTTFPFWKDYQFIGIQFKVSFCLGVVV